ncbi:MAG: tRNA (adenosine(37)-N6)-threonylcarbamoyltransferase complex dimerization subunit type 1 TsaB [Dehalococcoidia bacterium]
MILAIDTASPSVMAVGLGSSSGDVIEVAAAGGVREQGTQVITLIDQIVGSRRQDIDAIAVISGPGSYAGLRIGIATAQSLGLGLGRPVVGAGTFEAVREAAGNRILHAIHPAGRGEWAIQREPGERAVTAAPRELGDPALLAGEGSSALGGTEVSPEARVAALLRIAARLLLSGEAIDPVAPYYLREPNISRPKRTPLVAGTRQQLRSTKRNG